MEERVCELWHRLITWAGERRYPGAAVQLQLDQVANTLGIWFRALGGDGGLEVRGADATAHGARRGLLARIAGVGDKVALAWRDERALLLPPVIDRFADPDRGSTGISISGSRPWQPARRRRLTTGSQAISGSPVRHWSASPDYSPATGGW